MRPLVIALTLLGIAEGHKEGGVRMHPRALASTSPTSSRIATSTTHATSSRTTVAPAAVASTSSTSTRSSSASASSPNSLRPASAFASAHPSAVAAAAPVSATGSCASSYKVAQVTGTGSLPKPTSFVQKVKGGQGLVLGGTPFRVVGPNIYWLCQDENTGSVGAYTDKSRVREALAIAVAMGANTIRALSCGISMGSQYSLESSLNNFGSAAQWDIHDYVIWAAGQYGLRIIMTLGDNYDYYTGGKYTFLRWRGLSTANHGALFYTDPTVIADFQTYMINIIQHVNPYNGLKYSADPTILAWETGNEWGGYIGYDGYPPQSWTSTMVQTIKSVDANHLIIDGTNGFYNYSTKATAPGLNIGGIDIMSDHGYPRNIALLQAEIPLATSKQKGFIIGEMDWTNSFGGDSLGSYLSYIESTGSYLGSMIWNIMGHDAQCCNWVQHNDGYSAYYPNGNSVDLQRNLLLVTQHWARVQGKSIPNALRGVKCPQPVF